MPDLPGARPQRGDLRTRQRPSGAHFDLHLAGAAAGRLDLTTFTVVSAWGRKDP